MQDPYSKEAHRARLQALKKLQPVAKEWKSARADTSLTERLLQDYLSATTEYALSENERLIALSAQYHDPLDWASMRFVFEFAATRVPDQAYFMDGICTAFGIGILQQGDKFDVETRIAVARDLELLFEKERQSHPNPGAEGMFWYHHPLRSQDEKSYLKRAIENFEAFAKEVAEHEEFDASEMVYLANAYFEYGDLSSAKKWYDRIDLERLEQSDSSMRAMAEQRLAECNRRSVD